MTELISQSFQTFTTPRDVRIGDKIYKDIESLDTRDFVDNNGRRKLVNYMDTPTSEHVAYVEHNKVVRSQEYYNVPQTIKLGKKTYNNVISKTSLPNSTDIYTTFEPYGHMNQIKIRKNGSVTDMNELRHKIFIRKLTQPFIRLAKILH